MSAGYLRPGTVGSWPESYNTPTTYRRNAMDPNERKEIQELYQQHWEIRAIARKLGRDPKTVRKALDLPPSEPQPPKLEKFKDSIKKLAAKGLKSPRILRDIRAKGYTGGKTILKKYLREIRGPQKKPTKVSRRFETKMAEEGQMDWSPYRLVIGAVEMVVHCFSLILCYSRRIWIGFFRNEKLPTLLYAHVEALHYHQGCPHRLVYDNQTAVTLGRVGRKPLWNPTFREFANHYGFKPFACRPRHKERKGKIERPFGWIYDDFLRGTVFHSLEDLNQKACVWLDTVANVREHSTTGRLVDAMYAEEQPFLIALPALPYHTERQEVRTVQKDGYVPVDASFYPTPIKPGQKVRVLIYPTRVEILDAAGTVVAAYAVPDRPTRIPAPWQTSPTVEPTTLTALETGFLARFPRFPDFLEGLKCRMNALTPIHLRQIERLVGIYGEACVTAALERALTYRNFSALSVARILERAHPNVIPEPPVELLTANPHALGALDEVDSGSPEDYTLDSMPPTEEETHGEEA
jgi:transposase